MAKSHLLAILGLALLVCATAQSPQGARPNWYRRPRYPALPTNTAWDASITGLWRVSIGGAPPGTPTVLLSVITSGTTVAATGVVEGAAAGAAPVTAAGLYTNTIPAGGNWWIYRGYAVYRVAVSSVGALGGDTFNVVLVDANTFFAYPGNATIPSPPTALPGGLTGTRVFNL